ncbi:hypothetical protein N869_12915 [Cellulomonas bogoriensis 69B4 = DSM 16987]|uniref:DUF8094 domain-containing protein n=1 Tax=Cellulomonas bogoriensis 69B4 = DSM 16987 TaxID=1386082 RepID=A0A0A0BYW6_9CELL|nr:hypothetical protein N869_12915 [Cellulomonas bogoriensis 69B4 = DSM 16987]
MTVTTGAVALCVLLAACASPLPEPDPEPQGAPPPAVVPAQVDRVLDDLADVLAEADAEGDASILRGRVEGPALTLRSAEYEVADAADDDEGVVTVVPARAQTVIVPTTQEWPRTVMVVTEAPEDLQPPLLLTLVQAEPRDPYRLWAWARLFPGVQMPATNQPELGSEVTDAGDLVLDPEEVVQGYVDLLRENDEAEHWDLFEEDPLREGIATTRRAFRSLVDENGTLSQRYRPGEGAPQVIGTADGGAIVVGTMETITTITLEDSTLTVGAETAALLGEETVSESLAITWTSVLAFSVPPAGSEGLIEVLGAEHTATEVTGE